MSRTADFAEAESHRRKATWSIADQTAKNAVAQQIRQKNRLDTFLLIRYQAFLSSQSLQASPQPKPSVFSIFATQSPLGLSRIADAFWLNNSLNSLLLRLNRDPMDHCPANAVLSFPTKPTVFHGVGLEVRYYIEVPHAVFQPTQAGNMYIVSGFSDPGLHVHAGLCATRNPAGEWVSCRLGTSAGKLAVRSCQWSGWWLSIDRIYSAGIAARNAAAESVVTVCANFESDNADDT